MTATTTTSKVAPKTEKITPVTERKDDTREILQRLEVAIEEIGTVETAPRLDGRQMTMVLAPLRRKKARSDSGSKKAGRAEDTTETVEEPEEE